ncbi:MAG TPA: DUF2079 domain-containing protein [Candidatus Binatia bacterium]|nr:DUF2079 domain-containing protein [Candidatus Binatia bacterium]
MRRVVLWYAVYVAVLSALAGYRWRIWSYGTDTGTFAQIALNAFSGFRDGPENASHFAFHWAPLLGVLYPFVALTRSALSIQIVQVVLIGASVFPFYAFLRRYADDALSSRIALLALVYPPLGAVAFTEFHEIAFYPLLAFLLAWSIDAERWAFFVLCSLLCVLVREEVPIVLGIFGAALLVAALLRRGRRGDGLLYWRPRAPRATALAGAWLIAVSAATLIVYFHFVVPALGGWRPAHFYSYPFANGPIALIAAMFVHPFVVLAAVATLGRLTYLIEAFAPLLFLPLASAWMIVALPGLAIVLLSSEGITWRMGSHYAAIYIPWLLLGTAAVLIGLARTRSTAAAQRLATVLFTLCAIVLIAFNPMHVGHYLTPPYADLENARKALAVVPRDANVSTHDEWYTHIAVEYPNATIAWLYPPEYAVFADDFNNGSFRAEVVPRLRDGVARGQYRIVAQYGAVKVYKRK